MEQVYIQVATGYPGPTTIRYGAFSREEAEAKLTALGWTPGTHILGHQRWDPPHRVGMATGAMALITPLVAEFPETIDVIYKGLLTGCAS